MRRLSLLAAHGDKDDAEDFYQRALIDLWELDPARFGADDRGYLKRALANEVSNACAAMADHL